MGVLVAQEFEGVGGEIGNEKAATWAQKPRRLLDCTGAVVKKMQDLMDDHDIEGVACQGEVVDVAVAHRAVLQSGAVETRARQCQHVQREIEAKAALDAFGEKLEHAPGTSAEIEQ